MPSYDRNLQDVLSFFHGKRLLTKADVSRYTGLKDYRAIALAFPFNGKYISAPTLAAVMAGER